MRKSDLERNNLIYNLYFEDKLNITQISKKIDLSISQVSRVLSKSHLYMQEKAERKEENRKKHSEQTKEIMKKKETEKMLKKRQLWRCFIIKHR